MAEALLQLEGVIKEYGTAVVTRALRGVDLAVGPGELLALTGPSGSGKSTLLNLIGLLDRPTQGRISINGVDTGMLDNDALASLRGNNIGFVFQFHHLLPAFSALENVMLPTFAQEGSIDQETRAKAAKLLTDVGLGDFLERKPSQLSGGQQQRVAIARALIRSPALVLADEPTGNLDQESGDQVFRLIRRLNQELGITCAIVTHDERLAARCDRNVHLVDGLVDFDRRQQGS